MIFAGVIDLDRMSAVPLPEQIYRAMRKAVSERRLISGETLPSSRELARALDVSRNTVNAAYELLAAEGFIEVRVGARPRIAAMAAFEAAIASNGGSASAARLSARGAAICDDPRWLANSRTVPRKLRLQPGSPAEDAFPRDDWARALRRAARQLSGGSLFYENASGYPPLRQALASYLARERGVRARAEQVLILPTAQASLHLIAQVLSDPGDCAWLEDPGYLGVRAAFAGTGLKIEPLPVDSEGADASKMPASSTPRLIYVTPSHQYPLGVRMALDRRLALIERARAAGAMILEDDYDSEFLFSGRPIAALQGLGGEGEVIYLGTFAKSMLPSLRVAYMVVPERIAAPLSQAQRNAGLLANVHTQAALADFIESGHYRAHLKRIRSLYEKRGRMLVEKLRGRLGNRIQVDFPTGGVQLAARLPQESDDLAIVDRMAARGFNLSALSGYGLQVDIKGLVIGFAGASEADIDAGVAALAEALDGL